MPNSNNSLPLYLRNVDCALSLILFRSSIGHSKYVNRSPPISFHSSPSNYQKFRAHNIDGSALLKLTESHLVDVMKFSLGPSVKLTNAVADKIRYLMKMKDVDKCIFDEF